MNARDCDERGAHTRRPRTQRATRVSGCVHSIIDIPPCISRRRAVTIFGIFIPGAFDRAVSRFFTRRYIGDSISLVTKKVS